MRRDLAGIRADARGFASVGASRGSGRPADGARGGKAQGPGQGTRSKLKKKSRPDSAAPPLREAMKALVRKVHPDLFRSGCFPVENAAEINDESLRTIQGVLDAVTKSRSIPHAGIRRLRFYVRDAEAPEGVRLVAFKFKTTGGDCRNLVARQLTRLFEEVGVPSEFRWEEGDWVNDPDAAVNASNRGDEPGLAGGAEGRGPTKNARGVDAKTLMGALKHNDKLFELIAAVPWIPEPEGDDRVRAIHREVIPKLLSNGWEITANGAVDKIWAGERDEGVLLDGLDAASGLAVSAIVKHARNFERQLGAPTGKKRANFYPTRAGEGGGEAEAA